MLFKRPGNNLRTKRGNVVSAVMQKLGLYVNGQLRTTGDPTSEIRAIDFVTDTGSIFNKQTQKARKDLAGASFGSSGYVFGGQSQGTSGEDTVEKILLGEGVTTILSNKLVTKRIHIGTNQSSVKSYIAGYVPGVGETAAIDRFDFSTEVSSRNSYSVSRARNGMVGFQSTIKGYFAGGNYYVYPSSIHVGTIDSIDYGTETTENTYATISPGRSYAGAVSCGYAGFIAGGYSSTTPYESAVIDKFQYATNVAMAISASLGAVVANSTGTNSNENGYFTRGNYNGRNNFVDKLGFGTETRTTTSISICSRAYRDAGISFKG